MRMAMMEDGRVCPRSWVGTRRRGRPRQEWGQCVYAHALRAAGCQESLWGAARGLVWRQSCMAWSSATLLPERRRHSRERGQHVVLNDCHGLARTPPPSPNHATTTAVFWLCLASVSVLFCFLCCLFVFACCRRWVLSPCWLRRCLRWLLIYCLLFVRLLFCVAACAAVLLQLLPPSKNGWTAYASKVTSGEGKPLDLYTQGHLPMRHQARLRQSVSWSGPVALSSSIAFQSVSSYRSKKHLKTAKSVHWPC